MKISPFFPLAGLSLLLVLALWPSGRPTEMAHAQTPVLVALDMDPTGNCCPGDGVHNCMLGPIDTCVNTSPGSSFTFDVILRNLPPHIAGEGLGAIDFKLRWGNSVVPPEADVIDITARAPMSRQVHLLAQASRSAPTLNDPQTLPRLAPPYVGSVSDLGEFPEPGWGDEPNPPWTQGVAWRGTVTVDPAAAAGTYTIFIPPGTAGVGNVIPYDECYSGPGCTIQNGLIAIAPATCSGAVGGITELERDPSALSAHQPDAAAFPYVRLGVGVAAVLLALTTGAWYARRRWLG